MTMNFQRGRRAGQWALALTIALCGWAGLSHAQSGSGAPEAFQAWRYNCVDAEERRECSILSSQTADDGNRLYAIEIRRQNDQSHLAIFQMPFGILLEEGLQLSLDGRGLTQPLSFRTCLPTGCMALLPVDAQLLQQLRAGTSLRLRIRSVNGEELAYEASLMGLTAALNRLSSTN